jgi:hypothetical protein
MRVNGEGTGATATTGNEISKHKDLALRVAISPFESGAENLKSLKINGYIGQGSVNGSPTTLPDYKRNRTILGLSYDGTGWNVAGNYYMTEDGHLNVFGTFDGTTTKGAGYSIYGNYDINSKYWILARYDMVDPDTNISNNSYTRLILGVGKKIADNVRVAVAYNGVTQEKEVVGTNDNQTVFSGNLEVKF